jgi:hypothetical protein
MQHFGCHGSQQKAPERPIAVRRHYDQVKSFFVRVLNDRSGRISLQDHPYRVKTLEFLREKGFQIGLALIERSFKEIRRVRNSLRTTDDGRRRRHDVELDKFGTKMACDSSRIPSRSSTAFREGYRKQDSGESRHTDSFLLRCVRWNDGTSGAILAALCG